MKLPIIVGFSALAVSLCANSVNADELCFSCVGLTYIHASENFEEMKLEDQQASLCINDSNNEISHLSMGADTVKGYMMTERYPETIGRQAYYYWESSGTYQNTRFGEELKIYVELSDIQYHIQVVHKNKSQEPRLAYNGRCHISKRLGLR